MKLKKIIINTVIIFLFGFIFHNLFKYLPIFPVSIISPVNESIFEHMKMIYTSYIFFILFIYLFYKKKPNNYILSNTLSSIINIIIFLILYLPIYKLFGENLILTLILYFISIFITSFIKEKIENKKDNRKLNLLSIMIIIFIYIIFGILTYFPIKASIFMDPLNNTYGIYKVK